MSKKIIGIILITPIIIPTFIVWQISFSIISLLGLPFWFAVDLIKDENNAIDIFIGVNKIPYEILIEVFD